jgi:8-oxo-dGTP pyrophosphatase MutT (NUDIX family)
MRHFEKELLLAVRNALTREPVVIDQPDLTPAAVLVPVVIREREIRLVLTRRTLSVASHKGQISFPGGVREPSDKDATETALREAREEIGLSPDLVSPAGRLDDLATISGFRITPVVGIVDAKAPFTADPREVAELFEIPLSAFRDPAAHELVTVDINGTSEQYHSYEIESRIIWGATAGIIHRFLTQLDGEGPYPV